MFSKATLIAISAALVTVVGATPTAEPLAGLTVITRKSDFSYSADDEMTRSVRARMVANGEHNEIEKRSFATVQACRDTECSDCEVIYNGEFSTFQCLSAINTVCIIASDLNDAHVVFWNNEGCNGNESNYYGCDEPAANVGAAGTNSIGVQIGC